MRHTLLSDRAVPRRKLRSMLNSEQRYDAPMSEQVDFWNRWNAEAREASIGRVSIDQAETITGWLGRLGRRDLDIIDVGCGAGWLCERLTAFGRVTGTDLATDVVARAAQRLPAARFVAGDFMALDFAAQSFDVVTSLEVLPHVVDQAAFLEKIAGLLRPGGYFMIATQNRPVLEQNDIPPPAEGQIRHWVDRHELAELLGRRFEVVELLSRTPHYNNGFRRYLNSGKVHSILERTGLGGFSRAITVQQEKAWLGWTLMALARKKA